MMRGTIMPLRALVVCLLLAACGGGSSPAAPPAAGAPTAAATPSAPTQAPPAPSATPLPAATAGPAPNPLSCDHPFFPLREGATWSYRISGVGQGLEQTQTVTNVAGATAELAISIGVTTTANRIECTAAGLRFSAFPGGISQLQPGDGVQFETAESEGVHLLPADQLVPGATWDARYALEGKLTAAGQESPISYDLAIHFEVVGGEQVSVPAGPFEALKVRQQLRAVSQAANSPPVELEQFAWYARDVGLVKTSVLLTHTDAVVTELKSYNIP
jgi:hypothetical protein